MVIIIISNFEVKRLRLVEDKYSMIPQLLDAKAGILNQAFLTPKPKVFGIAVWVGTPQKRL